MYSISDIRKSITDFLNGPEGSSLTTPAYIYSVDQVGKNYRDLKEELGTPLVVSIKANHCLELLSRVAYQFDDGCEISSLGELRLRAGTKKKIYINTPAYTKKLVATLSRYNATFIVDHISQLDVIAAAKEQHKFANDVLLRLNFDAFVKSNSVYPNDHFGMDEKTLNEAINKAKAMGVKVAGLHIFCGSNNFAKKSLSCVNAIDRLYDRVTEMLGYPMDIINLGGGIPATWRESNLDFRTYRESLSNLKKKAMVIHESGRAIFGSAGYFLTEVISTKSINNKKFVVCDGGMAQNFLLAKTEHVIRKYDVPIVISNNPDTHCYDYTFVGASCNRDDVIGEIKSCQYDIKAGDKILFPNCGAYNALYTVNKFLSLTEHKEYII